MLKYLSRNNNCR